MVVLHTRHNQGISSSAQTESYCKPLKKAKSPDEVALLQDEQHACCCTKCINKQTHLTFVDIKLVQQPVKDSVERVQK